ncbi:MAG: uracil-DNA glycosylase [Clostridia bacterium]|nr:uracil-DNA glycosylase [Clostridia bacterium]
MSKQESLEKLYDDYRNHFEGKEIVLGDGSIDSMILLIGEAPGKDEVRLGRPFVGMAGKNLNEFLSHLNMEREKIYITNAIKYRLSEVSPQTGRLKNRPATKEEIKENMDFLYKEINIIMPKYIVTLGNVPLKSITGDFNASIGAVHGEIKQIYIYNEEFFLFPLYHPASIIYNRSLKEVYEEDLRKLSLIVSGK